MPAENAAEDACICICDDHCGLLIEVDKHRTLALVPIDIATATAAIGLSTLAGDLDDLIDERDINPLAVSPNGRVALDALIVPKSQSRVESTTAAHQ